MLYAGTSGIALPVANKKAFPEAFRDKSSLAYYASLFNSLEINSSFKKLPMAKTVVKWAETVPADFQFTFKCPAAITHCKSMAFTSGDVHRFFEVIDYVESKKGCVLIQFPGKITIDYFSPLQKLLDVIYHTTQANAWRIAVEFRHPSWYVDETWKLLHAKNIACVFHDLGAGATSGYVLTADFVYQRFHGTEKGYRGSYSDEYLSDFAMQVNTWNAEAKDVYVYFNNTLGDAAKNLLTLNHLLS